MSKRRSKDLNNQFVGVVAIIVVAVFVIGVIIIFAKSLFSGVESDLPIGLDTATVTKAEAAPAQTESTEQEKKTTKKSADKEKKTTTTTTESMGTKSVLEYAYLRKEPAPEGEAIICMSPGVEVTILSEADENGYVKATFLDVSGQLTGYVHESYLG